MTVWSPEALGRAVRVLRQHPTVEAAAAALGVSRYNLIHAFARNNFGPPKDYLSGSSTGPTGGARAPGTSTARPAHVGVKASDGVSAGATPETDPEILALLDVVRDGETTMAAICNTLEASPAKVESILAKARVRGYALQTFHGELHFRLPEPTDEVQETGVAGVVGERFKVGVISDLHFGSKHHGTQELRDALALMRDEGITEVLDPGDNLDGNYKFSLYEQSHRGFDEQAEHMYETFRLFPDLTFHTIDGNHDDTLSESCGMQTGQALVERFRTNGLENLRYYGSRAATLNVGGAKVLMWHPRGGGSYAISYKLQKKVESFAPGAKCDILLTGHWHKFGYITERGVHAFLCPTFQLPGGSFGNSLVGEPAVGGMILSWDLTEHGTLRRFQMERLSYYVGERRRKSVSEMFDRQAL